MHFDIFTLFPEMFQGPFSESILKRAQDRGLLSIALHNIRESTSDKHHVVDDYPYGGGAGMVMKPEPIFTAVESVYQSGPIILLSPQGRRFNQHIARTLAQEARVTLICGHYEGIDERVREHLVTDELSIGDYVLTGGELAAMIVVDATSRLLPGVPSEFRGWRVPDVLLSGNHTEIARWRRKEAIRRTRERRPDLFEKLDLSSKENVKLLKELAQEQ